MILQFKIDLRREAFGATQDVLAKMKNAHLLLAPEEGETVFASFAYIIKLYQQMICWTPPSPHPSMHSFFPFVFLLSPI